MMHFGNGDKPNELMIPQRTMHCPREWTIGPAICSQQTYHRPNQPH